MRLAIVIVSMSVLLWGNHTYAANCNKNPDHPQCTGGGGGGGGDEICSDEFPSFAFAKQKKGKNLAHELLVSSSEGCRVEKLADIKAGRGPAFSYEAGKGLIAWAEGFETYDIHVLRFEVDESLDSKPIISNSGKELVLETIQPSGEDESLEYFFSLDVRADYSTTSPVELVAIFSLLDFAGGSGTAGQKRAIKVLDLNDASGPNTVWSKTLSEMDACVGQGASFDPTVGDGHLCMAPTGGIDFSESGDHIFFHSATPRDTSGDQWQAQVRLPEPENGWLSGVSEPELLYASQQWDCVAEAMPFGDDSKVIDLDGTPTEVLIADACIGIGGIRDQRLYFLDVEACATDPYHLWQNCHIDAPTLYSGQIRGRGASWREDGEVLYGGFENRTLDSIRAFNPSGSPAVNDREIVRQGETPDSSL